MNDCCDIDVAIGGRCPSCGEIGRGVGAAPVRAHRPDAIEGGWRFCPNLHCRVVFYLGHHAVDEDSVIAQVGVKALMKPIPVCFCFAHTTNDIGADLAANGVSTIMAAVKSAVAGGLCACEHLNPSGRCCLPDIHRAVKAAATPNSSPK